MYTLEGFGRCLYLLEKNAMIENMKQWEEAMRKITKFIGNRDFYKMVLMIAVPIMIQNGITNFVSLLDNIMIGQVGTEQMSGVAIVNQLIFVYNLCIFGGVSGAGIFTAQYFGQGNHEGVRQTMRFKLWMVTVLTTLTVLLFLGCGTSLISAYLKGDGSANSIAATLFHGERYLRIMLMGLPAFAVVQIYSSTLRECGQTMLPMKAGLAAVVVNLLFNYILIYGKFGAPALGVSGAATATVLSRYVEMLIIVIGVHRKSRGEHAPYSFVTGLYSTLKVPKELTLKIVQKGSPLLFNETLWAAGMAMLTQCYSVRGLNVVAGLNVSNTINNVFNIVFIALGDSVAIIVGQLLGAGKMKEARDTDNKLIAFSVMCCTCVALVMFVMAPLFPRLYKINDEARMLAKYFIMVTAFFMPQNAFLHATYFTLRSGGKTIITFLFDSVFIWCVSVVIAFTLSRYTGLPVIAVYAMVQLGDIIKCVIGFILVKKGVWLQNIVA